MIRINKTILEISTLNRAFRVLAAALVTRLINTERIFDYILINKDKIVFMLKAYLIQF